jgi:murein L,D-transpeptidase YcbB/YkuD
MPAGPLASVANTPELKRFYAHMDWRLAWSDRNEAALIDVLRARKRHGLDRIRYPAVPRNASQEERDAHLTTVALRYATALARGQADPTRLYDVYTIDRPALDLPGELARAAKAGRLEAWFDTLSPASAEYETLSRAYLELAREDSRKADRISVDDLVRPGESNVALPEIRAALKRQGYLSVQEAAEAQPEPAESEPAAGEEDRTRHGPADVAAIKRLQEDYGLKVDGIIGPNTVKALNFDDSDRVRMLAVAMERLRWLVRSPAATRIDVNTAVAELVYFVDGTPADRRKVVVGKAGWETPQLQSPIYRMVANPTWTVPTSIIRKEMSHRGPEYFEKEGLEWRGDHLVQRAGPDNALGLVKFDMINNHQIYLHDTPGKKAFDKNDRHLSHGCVRVQGALDFAERLTRDLGVEQEWASARGKGPQTYMNLPAKIPVRLLYHTAFADDTGGIRYTTDPYGWDDPVARTLGF